MLGGTAEEAAELIEDVRMRDRQRFKAQLLGACRRARPAAVNAEEQARSGAVSGPGTPIIAPPDEEGETKAS